MPENESLDVFGVKPLAEATKELTSAMIAGAGAFLGRICLPVAEEVGLLLRDRVRIYRAANVVAIARAAERKLNEAEASESVNAHPRLVDRVLEEGSWIDDSEVQEMWGGLLASACSDTGDDDSNLLFVNLLSGLTGLQARILRYACEQSKKIKTTQGLIGAQSMGVTPEELVRLTGEQDIQRLDREMDNLRAHDLLDAVSGFSFGGTMTVGLTPTSLALHMYVRSQGVRSSPVEYFAVTEVWELVGGQIWRPVETGANESQAVDPR